MDRNTLTGVLLMGALLMGFMYCNRQQADKAAEEAAKQQKEQQAAQKTEEKIETLTLSDSEAANMAGLVRANGVKTDSDINEYQLDMGTALLTVSDTLTLGGTVNVAGEAVDVAKVVKVVNAADTTLDQGKRNLAVQALNAAAKPYYNYGTLSKYIGGQDSTLVMHYDEFDVTFSSRGGAVQKVVLNKYDNEVTGTAKKVVLFDGRTGSFDIEMQTANKRLHTKDLNFDVQRVDDKTVLMSMALPGDASLALKYTVVPDKYLVKMAIETKNLDAALPGLKKSATMFMSQKMQRNEVGRTFEERNSAVYYKLCEESPEDMDEYDEDEETVSGKLKWVAFKNQFFSTAVIAKSSFNSGKLKSVPVKSKTASDLKNMDMEATFDFSANSGDKGTEFAFYYGPNLYPLLTSLDEALPGYGDTADDDTDLMMRKLVPLGWGIFGWINRFVVIPVFTFLGKFISSYGIIILLLTLFIKLILFPLTYKSYKSQAKMRVLAPEIKELNEKYPGNENAIKRQQETMKLYSRAGASPFSGCLPMLLQMPVLIAMFAFFPSAIELRGQSFLWAHDLSAPDYIFTLPFSIPFLGNHLSLFCLLMTAVNIIYTRINMQSQPTQSTMPAMKWMMYLMPVMFLFFFNDYASGLSYYYFLSLLITIVQTYAFRLFIDEGKVRAEMEANAKKPRKKSGFMARLEAAQKRQEAMMREQAKQNAKRRR